jgi:hypothetical protein
MATEQLGLPLDGPARPTQVPDQGAGRRISQVALASLDLPRLQRLMLAAVVQNPGSTMDELGDWLRAHHRDASAWACSTLSGRLNDLSRAGLAFRRGTRPGRSGRPQGRWWPRP